MENSESSALSVAFGLMEYAQVPKKNEYEILLFNFVKICLWFIWLRLDASG